ncbi:MAG: threonine synthase [Alphaproteobacteria bacterium]|nr:threonine synthase [Alphaproteobacteria bacterium]
MRYVSTRGQAPSLSFKDVLLSGLARDGGLYVPAKWPRFSPTEWRNLSGRPYTELAEAVITPFIGDDFSRTEIAAALRDAYANFTHPAIAPIKQLGQTDFVMELFNGPTLAFKDFALQLLGRLFDLALRQEKRQAVILGATSGDTGSAAIEACRHCEALTVFILYPKGRMSDFQRRQMTTVEGKNVYAIAVEGSFDDAQDCVKALFNDLAFRDEVGLAAINSINWARIMAQVVYYAYAGLSLGAPDREIDFAVPTGNFGNIYAGYVAREMGLPIGLLALATNRNDVMARVLATGEMSLRPVEQSLSPSMDIQISSNFERLLFDLFDRDGLALAAEMEKFRKLGKMVLADNGNESPMAQLRSLFTGLRVDDATTIKTIQKIYRDTGEILDPHSAIAVHAMSNHARRQERLAKHVPMVALACAHPAKFAETVEQAIGVAAPPPPHLAKLAEKTERIYTVAATPAAVKEFMYAHWQR